MERVLEDTRQWFGDASACEVQALEFGGPLHVPSLLKTKSFECEYGGGGFGYPLIRILTVSAQFLRKLTYPNTLC